MLWDYTRQTLHALHGSTDDVDVLVLAGLPGQQSCSCPCDAVLPHSPSTHGELS